MEGSTASVPRASAKSTLKLERRTVDDGGSLRSARRMVAKIRLYIYTLATDKAVMWNR